MSTGPIYLDFNATSPLSESVQSWLKSGEFLFANPSSQHTHGKASRKLINEARALIFETFGKSEKDSKLFFHSGATEGIHTFAYSFSEMARLAGRDLLICYSKIDHPATTSLSGRYYGPHVKFLELERNTNLHYDHAKNFDRIKDKKDNNPDLIVLYHHLWVHNETGQISSLEELSQFKTIPDLYIHVDAVQVPGKIPEWRNLSLGDIWTFSAHKFGALKGIGFSFLHSSIPFYPLISGGGQQGALRSGTENVQGVKSVALALSDLKKIDVQKNKLMRDELEAFVVKELKGIGEVIRDENMASNTIYFYLNNLSSDIALALFDIGGIEISAGSACSSGAAKPSAILLEKGLNAVAKNGLRLSMGFQMSEECLTEIKNRLVVIFKKLR